MCLKNSILKTERVSGLIQRLLMKSMTRLRPVRQQHKVMHCKSPPRNRLAKVLPQEWREFLVAHGVPKRKYTAVLKAELSDGRIIEELIVEQGWIIALDRSGLGGTFEQRIDFDPRQIKSIEIVQVV